MSEIKEGSHVVVTANYPVKRIVGKTGTVEEVNAFKPKYLKNVVRFDEPFYDLGFRVERHWFCDEDLEVIEND